MLYQSAKTNVRCSRNIKITKSTIFTPYTSNEQNYNTVKLGNVYLQTVQSTHHSAPLKQQRNTSLAEQLVFHYNHNHSTCKHNVK